MALQVTNFSLWQLTLIYKCQHGDCGGIPRYKDNREISVLETSGKRLDSTEAFYTTAQSCLQQKCCTGLRNKSVLISGWILGVPDKTGQKSRELQLILYGCRDGIFAQVRLHVHVGVYVCRCKLMLVVSLGPCSSGITNFRFSGRVSH